MCGILGSSLLAQRSLDSHVVAVVRALETSGIEAGREAVSMIVGRNPAYLDASGVGEAKELCRFVEGFAGRIIQRPAQQCVAASATNLGQLRVAAAHQQGDVMGDLLTAEKG